MITTLQRPETRTETRPDKIAASTPVGRDRVIDFLRAMSLVVVIFGHWLMASVTVTSSPAGVSIAGENALSYLPLLQPVTWILQVMPLFFVAGGFANLTVWRSIHGRGGGYANFLYGRLNRLVRPTLVFVVAIPLVLAALRFAGIGTAEIQLAGNLLGQPLWFLGVYVVVTALAPAMASAHAHRPVATLVGLSGVAVAVDVARLTWLEPFGYVNVLIVWLLVQQVGFWYAAGKLPLVVNAESRRAEKTASRRTSGLGDGADQAARSRQAKKTWWTVLLASVATLVALTALGPYPVSMVGLPGEMSNMAPPSICLVVLAAAQTSVVMLIRPRLARWLERPRPWAAVVTVGSMAMTVYLWHLAVLVAGFGATVIGGLPIPEPGTAAWWLSRPVWLAALTTGLAGVALAMSRFERVARRTGRLQSSTRGQAVAASLGGTLVAAGLLGYVVDGMELTSIKPALNALLLVAGLVVTQFAAHRRILILPAGRAPSIPE